MVSWLGDYTYEFPKPIPLVKRLRDYLEDEVDEKYYLSEEQVATFVARSEEHKKNGNGFLFEPIDISDDSHTAHTIRERYRNQEDNFVYRGGNALRPSSPNNGTGSQATISKIGNITSVATGKKHQWGDVYRKDGIAPTQCSRDWKTPTLIGED